MVQAQAQEKARHVTPAKKKTNNDNTNSKTDTEQQQKEQEEAVTEQQQKEREETVFGHVTSPSMAFQQDTIEEVYQIILPKMINSRFSVVFRKWKEAHCQKHEMSLRSSLKAGVSSSKSLPLKRAATQHTDESTNEIKKAKSSE